MASGGCSRWSFVHGGATPSPATAEKTGYGVRKVKWRLGLTLGWLGGCGSAWRGELHGRCYGRRQSFGAGKGWHALASSERGGFCSRQRGVCKHCQDKAGVLLASMELAGMRRRCGRLRGWLAMACGTGRAQPQVGRQGFRRAEEGIVRARSCQWPGTCGLIAGGSWPGGAGQCNGPTWRSDGVRAPVRRRERCWAAWMWCANGEIARVRGWARRHSSYQGVAGGWAARGCGEQR